MQKVGGVSNCFVELIAHLPRSVDWTIGLKESNNVHLREKGLLPNILNESLNGDNFLMKKHFLGKETIFKYLNEKFVCFPSSEHVNKKYSIELLEKQDFDLFHPTFFNPYFLDYLGAKPFILTVHDFITDKFCNSNDIQTKRRKILASKAAHLIAVSEKTKQDAIDFLQIPSDKISVIYHGVSIPDNVHQNSLVDGNYFLFVGKREGYKNFRSMVKAMAPFLQSHRDYKLVCTAGNFNKEECALFDEYKIKDQIIHVFASNNELLSLYKYAKAFIYPSLYEGFGIPILEAYAMQCPVLLSDESCFPEIAGDAALYFKLNHHENTLTALLEDVSNMSSETIMELIKKQDKQLKKYSWEKSAMQLAELYQVVIDECKKIRNNHAHKNNKVYL